ncbi:Ig-like domain-containing protein [Ruminococcus sp.]|uniref:Ig-like domain-containing protein n=1 Tax=Ruminococcus sp. TaxID=41978 RepID=UPI002E8007D6|nr:Ig-like domain-containing protein [Ruminococcus sp.]MEE3440218.1 Ig-like domain-containing protein [Ruminococcus sp.]
MNILIIADKKTSKEYTELLKATPNINVLGVVNSINSIDSVKSLRQKYNPLGLLVDTSVRHKGIDISLLIKSLQKVFNQSRILLFASNDEIELFNDFGLYGVIGNTITSIQFNEVIKSFVNNENIDTSVISQELTDRYIKRNTKTKTSLVNKKIIPIILIALVIILLIVCFVLKNNDSVDNLSTPDEATITSTSTIPTEEKTTVSSVIENTSNSEKYVTNNQVIVNTTTIPPSTVPTTTKIITTQPTTKKVFQKKRKKKSSNSNSSSNNNASNVPVQTQPPVTKRIVKKKPKTQTQIKIDYGNNNWSNNGKVETSISLSYYSKTLEVADSVTITATVTPKRKKVHWSSSNTSVATIKQNGYVKAKNVGTATITATADGKSATCTIYVKKRT